MRPSRPERTLGSADVLTHTVAPPAGWPALVTVTFNPAPVNDGWAGAGARETRRRGEEREGGGQAHAFLSLNATRRKAHGRSTADGIIGA